MITGVQIKTARKLLGWNIRDLARHASVEIADVQEAETCVRLAKRHFSNVSAIQRALENAGIEFIDSVGVRFFPHGFEKDAVR
jgi:nucleoside-triphosphatase THEP1